MFTGDGKTDAEFEEGAEVRIPARAARPNLRVCESPYRGFAQQPQEINQDAQQLRTGCRKPGLSTLLQQSGMSSPGMVVLCGILKIS